MTPATLPTPDFNIRRDIPRFIRGVTQFKTQVHRSA